MVSLGQWMMNTPWSRACRTASFIRGAISATRRVAPAHQCRSHISQMTMAVFFGSHSTVFSTNCHWSLPRAVSMRLRVERYSGLEESAARLARLPANSKAADIQGTRQGEAFIVLVDDSDAIGPGLFTQLCMNLRCFPRRFRATADLVLRTTRPP